MGDHYETLPHCVSLYSAYHHTHLTDSYYSTCMRHIYMCFIFLVYLIALKISSRQKTQIFAHVFIVPKKYPKTYGGFNHPLLPYGFRREYVRMNVYPINLNTVGVASGCGWPQRVKP